MIGLLLLRIKILFAFLRDKSEYSLDVSSDKNNIFLFLGADYGNIGDVAITYAQLKFLKKYYQDYNVIEIPISRTYAGIKAVKNVIKKEDFIVLIGGGNTSDLYDDIEWLRQLVILNFLNYKILAFPQTFDFSKTLRGYLCKRIASWVYNKAKHLIIIAREQNTMDVLRNDFKGIKSLMAPDIVMTLDLRNFTYRNGVLVCLRSDKEGTLNIQDKEQIFRKLKTKFKNIYIQDTQVMDVNTENRFKKMFDIINIFRKHELVITDRLHGMILCYITGTPALVYDNSNHKISACFQWIKDCGYIKLINSLEDIESFEPIDNFERSNNLILRYYGFLINREIVW